MQISLDQLKKLRADTQAGVSDCRQALEEADGDYEKAKKILIARGIDKAAKKADRATGQGVVEAYVHATGAVGVLVTLKCETDFVAANSEFRKLAHEIALQIAAMNPKNADELLKSAYIRDPSLTVENLIKQTIAKTGENITLGKFVRMTLES